MDATIRSASEEVCCSTCGSAAVIEANDTTLEIACSLEAGDFNERIAGIQALARRALLSSRREPLRLHLTYSAEALADVRELRAKESDCCAFLDFDLRHDKHQVDLTITAPVSAALAADELFAHFAPELARVTS